jgi:Ca-activated chloride channel family protein
MQPRFVQYKPGLHHSGSQAFLSPKLSPHMKHKNSFFALPSLGIGGSVLLLALFVQSFIPQSLLTGNVSDGKEVIIGATIRISQGATLVKGVITDFNGNFSVELQPGIYDIECTYTGYKTFTAKGVDLKSNTTQTLNIVMDGQTVLDEVVVVGYAAPLIEQDQTSSGQTLTSEQIKKLPTREVSAIKASTVGASSTDGGNVNIKGARANGTDYYIDGIRVSGGIPPVQETKAKPAPEKSVSGVAQPSTPQPAPLVSSPASTGDVRKKSKDEVPVQGIVSGKPTPDPIDDVSNEQYNRIAENPFQDAKSNGISTFSIDVDAASYANMRRFINAGQLPPRDAVRIEEMINYFDYQYNAPKSGRHPFEVNTEVAPCPWNPQNRLMTIGIQGEKIDVGQLPASNLVFLIDVSGSMGSANKLPLVKESLLMLTEQLRPNDRVAIVVYAGAAGLVLESTPGSDKPKIKAALEALNSGGSTAGGAGIKLAYDTARKNLIANGNNRVILCSDGDFNVGVSSEDELVKLIENERKSGVYLTVLGYGMGNYQDGKMQSLADKGNGNHAYIDQISEAKKVLMQEFGGTLFAIAKDVKLQLHFNPVHVAGYRLIGYENRMLATEDFHDDTKDAGELGAGHRVTAIYEIIPAGQTLPTLTKADSAMVVVTKPDTAVTVGHDDLMVLQLRYKKPKGEQPSQLMEYRLNAAALDRKTESENFLLASSIAEFGMLLRDSKHKGSASYEQAIRRAREAAKNDPSGYRKELVLLMERAQAIAVPAGTAKK